MSILKRQTLRGRDTYVSPTAPAQTENAEELRRLPGEGIHEYVTRMNPAMMVVHRSRFDDLLRAESQLAQIREEQRALQPMQSVPGRLTALFIGGPADGEIRTTNGEPYHRVRERSNVDASFLHSPHAASK